MLLKHLKYPYQAPETGEGEGGASSSGGDGQTKVTFDEAQQKFINDLIAKEKGKVQEKVKAQEAKLAALEEKLSKLVEQKAEDSDPKNKTEEGRIEVLQKRHERELAEQKAKLDELTKRAEDAERKRLEAERDRLLNEALQAAGCNDLKAGYRYFLFDITREDEDGETTDTWLLKSPSGKLVDIATGVMEHLPKSLRGPAVNVGGAGTLSGGLKAKDKDKIKQLEAEVEQAKQLVQSRPTDNAALAAFRRKSQELKAAKAALKTP